MRPSTEAALRLFSCIEFELWRSLAKRARTHQAHGPARQHNYRPILTRSCHAQQCCTTDAVSYYRDDDVRPSRIQQIDVYDTATRASAGGQKDCKFSTKLKTPAPHNRAPQKLSGA